MRGVSLVLIRRNKKSRVATTADTCCDGLEIIRLGRSVDIDTDRVTGFMEILDLLVNGFLADLFAVLLVQACVSTKQTARLHPACTACTSTPCSQPCSDPVDTEVTSALLPFFALQA